MRGDGPSAQSGQAPDAWDPVERTRALAIRLVGWPSETGTSGEAAFPMHLAGLLRELPYFAENPAEVVVVDSHGAPRTRSVVAVVRGTGPETLALAGHFDTASIANYHDLAPLACQPEALARALRADLAGRALSGQEARARADLESGDFIPGRAMLDMKSGLAAGIAVLERFAANPDRRGNLVFVATPDEERESRGMRSLRDALPALMRERGLRIVGGVNLDATSDQGDGAEGRAVYKGTIGKLLPFVLAIGQASHASYPFEGVSAALIGAEILRAIEGDAALADQGAGWTAPPPICLEARDLRDGYEATTPERFWLAFNWLYHAGSPEALFHRFRAEVEAALGRALARFAECAQAFAEASGGAGPRTPAPAVLTLAELRARALRPGGAVLDDYARLEAECAALDNPLAVCRRLTGWLADRAQLAGPAVVIGFAGLHYPPSRLDPADPGHAALRGAVDAARAAFADDPATAVRWRPIFQGISDMSFFGRPATAGSEIVAENTPASRLIDRPSPEALAFPVVNIGPWGREYHQRLERVHAPYAFGTLPKLIARVVDVRFGGALS